MAGLSRAAGTYISFLDSDDRVHSEKYHIQLAALKASGAGLAYSDEASIRIEADGREIMLSRRSLPDETSPLAFLLRVQPCAHNPVFERDWLQSSLMSPRIPLDSLYRPIGDIWVYYNLAYAPRPAVKVNGDFALVVQHCGERYSTQWELTGLASCALMSRFASDPPAHPHRVEAMQLLTENAICTARALPPDTPADWLAQIESLISVTRVSPREVGGAVFAMLVRFLGIERTIRILRRWQRPCFDAVRSNLTDAELAASISAMLRVARAENKE